MSNRLACLKLVGSGDELESLDGCMAMAHSSKAPRESHAKLKVPGISVCAAADVVVHRSSVQITLRRQLHHTIESGDSI